MAKIDPTLSTRIASVPAEDSLGQSGRILQVVLAEGSPAAELVRHWGRLAECRAAASELAHVDATVKGDELIRDLIRRAEAIAKRLDHAVADERHLLYAFTERRNTVSLVLGLLGLTPETVADLLARNVTFAAESLTLAWPVPPSAYEAYLSVDQSPLLRVIGLGAALEIQPTHRVEVTALELREAGCLLHWSAKHLMSSRDTIPLSTLPMVGLKAEAGSSFDLSLAWAEGTDAARRCLTTIRPRPTGDAIEVLFRTAIDEHAQAIQLALPST